jgi:hypothetical protein
MPRTSSIAFSFTPRILRFISPGSIVFALALSLDSAIFDIDPDMENVSGSLDSRRLLPPPGNGSREEREEIGEDGDVSSGGEFDRRPLLARPAASRSTTLIVCRDSW